MLSLPNGVTKGWVAMWQRSACWLALVVAACAGPSPRTTSASDAAQASPQAPASASPEQPAVSPTPLATPTARASATNAPVTSPPVQPTSTPRPTVTAPPASSPAAFPYTISGRVTSGGAPVGGVRVDVLGDLFANATTGDDGRYEIAVPNGTFGLYFDPPAPFIGEYHLDAASTSDASPVRVSGGSVTVNADLLRGATLAGTVLCGRTPTAKAAVALFDADPPHHSYVRRTDSNGTYRIGLPIGRYQIVAIPPKTSSCALGWAGTDAHYREAATEIVLSGDLTMDVLLPAGRKLSGTVTKADGSVAAGAQVEAYGSDPDATYPELRERRQVNVTGTDASGRYEMVVPPTTVRLYAFVPGTGAAWWEGQTSYVKATPVDLTAGARIIDIRLAAR